MLLTFQRQFQRLIISTLYGSFTGTARQTLQNLQNLNRLSNILKRAQHFDSPFITRRARKACGRRNKEDEEQEEDHEEEDETEQQL